jgi:hypothetical protein
MSTTRPTPDGTPAAPVTPADDSPVAAQAESGATTATVPEREFTVRAMTSRELVTRRFMRHRGALAGFTLFTFIVLLSVTSIGAFGLPGWWGLSYSAPATVVEGGRRSRTATGWGSGRTRSARTTWAATSSRSSCGARRSP